MIAPMKPSAFLPVLAPLTLCASLSSLPGPAQAAEMTRAQIEAARARVETDYQDKVRECRQRFVVTSCLEDARDERIRLLRPLDRAEHIVNAEDRERRGVAARARVLENERQAAADEARRKTESVRMADHPASAPQVPAAKTPRANPELHQRQQAQQDAEAKAKAADRRDAAAERRVKAQQRQRKASEDLALRDQKRASAASSAKGNATPKPDPIHLPTPSASDIKALPRR